jgi:hypothetical protein
VYTDAHLDAPTGQLHTRARDGRAALVRTWCAGERVEQIRETICIDDKILIEGLLQLAIGLEMKPRPGTRVSWSAQRSERVRRSLRDYYKMETRVTTKAAGGGGADCSLAGT